MAKMKFKGLEEYENQLLKLQDITRECIGEAIYSGAKEIADAVKASIQSLPIDNRLVKNGEMLNGISIPQKKGLSEGFGIARLENSNGFLNVKLGFSGYNSVKTKQYPAGQPNSVIARSVNSGTSFRQKIPFIDNAVRQNKDAAEKAMKDKFDEALKKAWK